MFAGCGVPISQATPPVGENLHGKAAADAASWGPEAMRRAMQRSFAFVGSVVDLGRAVLLAAIYFVAAKLALLAAIPPGYATAVWPPSGIALAAVLLVGNRVWPGIWLGAALVNNTVQSSLLAAALMGGGNTLEALVGAALIRRYLGAPRRFERGADVLRFAVVAILSATVAATVAAVPLALVHSLSLPELYWNWWTWWQGDAMGIILVTPLILSWYARERQSCPPRKVAEGASLAAALPLTTLAIFSDSAAPYVSSLPMTFLVLPFVMWAAIRFRQREVTTLIAAVCAIAIYFTVKGRGPFAAESLNVSLLLLLAFMSTVAVTGLVLNAVVGERGRAMASLAEALRELREQAITDPLTALYNRRFLQDYLPRELARARRRGAPVAILMIDLDRFKRVNDTAGHAAGDSVLTKVGALLKRHIRTSDVACRYGGEEFLLVLPETALDGARRKAEQIRAGIERNRDVLLGVTASLGVALFPDHAADPDALTRAADLALYEAKARGRNRVVVSSTRLLKNAAKK
jgi:diguanylate cyclase (GGDEF)-like protein